LFEQVEGDVVLDEDSAAVGSHLGVLDLEKVELLFLDGAVESGRVELADLGWKEGRPAGFPVAGFGGDGEADTDFGGAAEVVFGLAVLEAEEVDVKFAGGFAEEVPEADGAAVAERPGEIRGEDGDARATGRSGAAIDAAPGLREDGIARFPGAQPDAVEGDAAKEEPGGDAGGETQVMALEAGVEGEDTGGGEEKRGPAERVELRVAVDEDGSEGNAVGAEAALMLDPGAIAKDEDAAVRDEAAHLGDHGLDLFRRAGGKAGDDGLGVLAEEAEPEAL
jgi:hypothetical protein